MSDAEDPQTPVDETTPAETAAVEPETSTETPTETPVETTGETPVETPEAAPEPDTQAEPEVPVSEPVVTDATSNTTGEPAVQQPVVPNITQHSVVSQDGPTARNNLLTAGELIENVLTHLNQNKSIHHDVTELEDKLKDARKWIADELDVPLTIFGNPAAN